MKKDTSANIVISEDSENEFLKDIVELHIEFLETTSKVNSTKVIKLLDSDLDSEDSIMSAKVKLYDIYNGSINDIRDRLGKDTIRLITHSLGSNYLVIQLKHIVRMANIYISSLDDKCRLNMETLNRLNNQIN